MSQNWWGLFPDVLPFRARRPKPLPVPGGGMPGQPVLPLQPRFAHAAFYPPQTPSAPLDPCLSETCSAGGVK